MSKAESQITTTCLSRRARRRLADQKEALFRQLLAMPAADQMHFACSAFCITTGADVEGTIKNLRSKRGRDFWGQRESANRSLPGED